MAVIWKYPLRITDKQIIEVPEGARFLHCEPTYPLWGKNVDPDTWSQLESWFYISDERVKSEAVALHIYGTGHPIPDEPPLLWLSTFRTPPYVWHLFKEIER